MIVELFGIPGAGKSTLVSAAAETTPVTTRHQVSHAWDRRPPLARAIAVCRSTVSLHRLALVFRLALHARITRPASLARLVRLPAKSDRLRVQTGTILLDQGLLQDVWSVLYGAGCIRPDVNLLSRFIGSLYRGMKVRICFIELDPETASARISGRSHGHSRLDGLDDQRIREDLERTAELPRRIIEAAQAAGVRVQRLDGSAPVPALVSAVRSALAE